MWNVTDTFFCVCVCVRQCVTQLSIKMYFVQWLLTGFCLWRFLPLGFSAVGPSNHCITFSLLCSRRMQSFLTRSSLSLHCFFWQGLFLIPACGQCEEKGESVPTVISLTNHEKGFVLQSRENEALQWARQAAGGIIPHIAKQRESLGHYGCDWPHVKE